MKTVLGLDIGTNSIGWALVEADLDKTIGKIIGLGVRILPTDTELLSKYEAGQAASKNALRRQSRGARRIRQRYKLRRQRLTDSLKILGWLPADFQPGHQLAVSSEVLLEMKAEFGSSEISADWVVYYLRHKALTELVSKTDLARILFHMNQRRGFKSNRKSLGDTAQTEDNDAEDGKRKREKKVEIVQITSVEDSGEKSKGYTLFTVTLSDGRQGTLARKIKPDWETKTLELEITTIPPTRKNQSRIEFRVLTDTDKDKWAKQKVAREDDIIRSGYSFPGTYYYHALKKDRRYVIKDVSIDRKFYQSELEAILKKQIELDPTLDDRNAIATIAESLYSKNEAKQKEIKCNGILHLFLKDIIYYHRPLKTKKSSIADCRLGKKNYSNPVTGKQISLKVAPSSSPVFQEFRIWQTINNIRVFQREKRDAQGNLFLDIDVTHEILTPSSLEALFELFDSRDRVSQGQILKHLGLNEKQYAINYFRQNEEKELPGNETKALIRKQFKKANYHGDDILGNSDRLYLLWHILYSLEDNESVLSALKRQFNIPASAAESIAQSPAFKPGYAAFSHQAMKRLLPLMRSGKYWAWDSIDSATKTRLEKILNAEFDERIPNFLRDLFGKHQITSKSKCQGMTTAIASYSVYGVHSEKHGIYYDRCEQVLPSGSLNLRNPLVEQVVNETLKVVHDIWKKYGRPTEIHIELARELKKNAAERKEITERNAENEYENKRIASLLRELNLGNPDSLADIERLKLWERQADQQAKDSLENIKFKRPSEPTKEEIQRYKLWSQQNFLSPYSGKPIPLSKLFTREYDIDHIIPRSRFFDDSLENKVVVETRLNQEKGNMTALEYVKCGSSGRNPLFRAPEYEAHVNQYFYGKKRRLLLSRDVPAGFANRQLVDTRYISRKLHDLLSPVAENRENPVIATSGKITSELKLAFGLGEKFKELVKWRFERLTEKTGKPYVWEEDEMDQEERPTGRKVLRLKGFEKRIDHRHHALDALIVACTSLSHIKYLNDLNATHYGKNTSDNEIMRNLPKLLEPRRGSDYLQSRKFRKPWNGFNHDAGAALESIVVAFRSNVRIYGKKANKNWRFIEQADGSFKKCLKPVTDASGRPKLSPYVRLSLHKANPKGKIILKDYEEKNIVDAFKVPALIANKIEKKYLNELLGHAGGDTKKAMALYKLRPLKDENGLEIKRITCSCQSHYYANRVDLESGFDEKRIGKIPDKALQRELLNHINNIRELNLSRDKSEQIDPFGAEGREILNKDRGTPLTKVTVKEESEARFEIRQGAFVEADAGNNLFFIIYRKNENFADRKFESIPLREVVKAKAEGSGFVEEMPGFNWFSLSPNDLVYLPDEDENITGIDWDKRESLVSKIYKFVSCNKGQAYFLPHTVAKVIEQKVEFDSLNKTERGLDGRMIKQYCIKLHTDRLGNIRPVSR